MTLLSDIKVASQSTGLAQAIMRHDTPAVFDALLTAFSYQGVSDQAARTYIEQNGRATWDEISFGLLRRPCPLLSDFDRYVGCRYDKGSFTCSEPEFIDHCPVPRHRLRNGRLNQTAYSFFLFVRDVAGSDLVGWINERLAPADNPQTISSYHEALINPMRSIYGVSDKILMMTLSELLLASPLDRWNEVGAGMIAIDTLVHNFLHRTGILHECGKPHPYGAACYAAGGCADILREASSGIDARRFNPQYPRDFPRFVQHAVWRYCAADGLNVCNGNRIDDRSNCQNQYCQIFENCDRNTLKTP